MPALVKKHNGELVIAYNFVATPTYTIYVADYAGGATPPDGWEYFVEDVTADQFVPEWKRPTGASDAYPLDALATHKDKSWRSTITGNVWEPGVSGWVDTTTIIPLWTRPTGAHDAYALNAVVQYENNTWQSDVAANVWAPGVYGWTQTGYFIPVAGPPPAWVQPVGSEDAYPLGAEVTHNGFVWVSTVAANVWEPGVYGWDKVA